jgi:hypothetical protein
MLINQVLVDSVLRTNYLTLLLTDFNNFYSVLFLFFLLKVLTLKGG